MKMSNISGCEYGRVNRMRLEVIERKLDEILINQKDLFNHQSNRWPPQAVWAMGILTAIATAIGTTVVAGLFG